MSVVTPPLDLEKQCEYHKYTSHDIIFSIIIIILSQ